MKKEQAIELANSHWWDGQSPHDIVMFQLFQPFLCMPFSEFHAATGKALGRPVYTHEFAFPDLLKQEFLGDRPAPTIQEVMDLIPAEKRIIVTLE